MRDDNKICLNEEKYNEALRLIEEKQWVKALKILEKLDKNYRKVEELIVKCEEQSKSKKKGLTHKIAILFSSLGLISIIIFVGIFFINSYLESLEFINSCEYAVEDGYVNYIKYVGNQENVIIPNKVWIENNEYQVRKIEQGAFSNCDTIRTVIIPDSVIELGSGVFSDCDNLEKVTFGNGIKEIPNNTFYKCNNLTEVELPENLDSLGEYAFFECGSIKELEIPDGVTSIGQYCFYDCEQMTFVYIPNTVSIIEDYAFSRCSLVVINYAGDKKPATWSEYWNSALRPVVYNFKK